MLAQTGEQVAARKEIDARNKYQQDSDQWVKNQLKHACYVSNKAVSVANEERQLGRPMHAATFKEVIQKLHPKLRVEHHPYSDDLCVYFLTPSAPWSFNPRTLVFGGEQKEFVTAVRDTVIPEWSVMSTKRVKEYAGERHIERGVPSYRWVHVPDRELTRGWRAVLAKLLHSGLVTLEQVNRIKDKYGSADRESWAAMTGHSGAVNPF